MLSLNRSEIPPHLLAFFRPRRLYKQKDDAMIPHRVYDALMADGWYGRMDCVWAKPNPMPESVTDRPTKAHEYLFLLSKSRSYFWDADAIREPHVRTWDESNGGSLAATDWNADAQACDGGRQNGKGTPSLPNPAGRNKRSVWTVATQPFPGAHFATFPPKLIEPCVLAGSSPQACAECGAPWERVTERTPADVLSSRSEYGNGAGRNDGGRSMLVGAKSETLGWQPTCDHSDGSARCTVLDPFSGAGTTGVVALRHDRDFIGIELNATYAQMARNRIYDDGPLLNTMLGEDAA